MVDQLRPVGSAQPRRSIVVIVALIALMVSVAALGLFVGLC
jgi:hypothetical protein